MQYQNLLIFPNFPVRRSLNHALCVAKNQVSGEAAAPSLDMRQNALELIQ
jgi:hypothetical protein